MEMRWPVLVDEGFSRCKSVRVQMSSFGAWLDVAIDNISRAVLYAWTLPGPAAAFPIALEFLTFVATHKVSCYVRQRHLTHKSIGTTGNSELDDPV